MHKYIVEQNSDMAAFFFVALVLFFFLLAREAFDLCLMKVVVSEDVFNYDIDNYLHDHTKIQQIKEDIMQTRNIQLQHSVNVDTGSKSLALLFDQKYSEQNLRRIIRHTRGKSHTQQSTLTTHESGVNDSVSTENFGLRPLLLPQFAI